jgi:hypothetical protein
MIGATNSVSFSIPKFPMGSKIQNLGYKETRVNLPRLKAMTHFAPGMLNESIQGQAVVVSLLQCATGILAM